MNKIFCIGLSRTGTTSLCLALEHLGFSTKHFSIQAFLHPEIIAKELRFEVQAPRSAYKKMRLVNEMKALAKSFEPEMINHFQVLGDLPFPNYFRELDKAFPNSKFILTLRDEEKWLKSMKWMFETGKIIWDWGEVNREILFQTYGCTTFDRELLLGAYRQHKARVAAHFSERSNDLLIIDLDKKRMDYPLICEFIGIPIPEAKQIPRANPTREVSNSARIDYWLKHSVPFYGTLKRHIAGA